MTLIRSAGVTKGCTTTTFCPTLQLTRGQTAAFLVRAVLNTDVFAFSFVPYFEDVPALHPYFKYIQKLRELNLTSGCAVAPARFCPDAEVTRRQVAKFIINARFGAQFPWGAAPLFEDVPGTDPMFSFIQRFRELGMTSGCSATAFCPEGNVTRADMAVFLGRAFVAEYGR
jgi:hypothetical protein